MTWALWRDTARNAHVVEIVDVPVMSPDTHVNPWHVIGDTCPCQPRVVQRDAVTGLHVIGHQDPVQ